jgi:methylglyoxal synthase
MNTRPRVALVAHDAKKPDMVTWAKAHREQLAGCELFATGTTGGQIHEATGLLITRFLSGPMGGDLQLGAALAEGKIDILIFFWDPLTAQPHDPDVRALIRVAVVWNIPVACNLATADLVIRGL